MRSDQQTVKRNWYSRGRWALILVSVGVLMVAFVAATRGEHAAWILWIAVPLLMFSLGYLYIVNAVATVWGVSANRQEEVETKEKDLQK